jgi:hypothetical protein
MKVDISDDGILYLYNAAQPQQYIYTGSGKFYSTDGSTYVSFEKESNGETYLYTQGYTTLSNLAQMASAYYYGQKIPENKLSAEVKAAWDKRVGKIYCLLNEKYSSQFYLLSTPFTKITLTEGIEGYFQSAMITDSNTAKKMLQIPGRYGRDLSDYQFYTKRNTEYLKAGAAIYLSEDAVGDLSEKSEFKVKLDSNGYAQWYKIGANSAGKKIEVAMHKNASFSVYAANRTCTFCSLVSNDKSVTLPAGGYIVFAGDDGSKFSVKYIN